MGYVHFYHIVRFTRFVRYAHRALSVPASVRLVSENSFITRNTLVAFVLFVPFVSQNCHPEFVLTSQGERIGRKLRLNLPNPPLTVVQIQSPSSDPTPNGTAPLSPRQ